MMMLTMMVMVVMMNMIMKHKFDDADKTQGSATYHQADIALLTLAKEDFDVDDNHDHDYDNHDTYI